MYIETKRLIIKEFNIDMAKDVHKNSLDEDNKKFVPDEVFETVDEAKEVISFLMEQYQGEDGPFVYPVIIKETKENIGYVQMIKMESFEWEVGYHIAKRYTGLGYATEAICSFLPVIAKKLGISSILGICLSENIASKKVLNKCGFKKIFEGLGLYQGEEKEIYKSVWNIE